LTGAENQEEFDNGIRPTIDLPLLACNLL